jgi:hydrogenase/urease accessory protein HupE
MNTSLYRRFALTLAFVLSSAVVWAHPGHDDRELTWDFSHLAAHPFATLGGLAVMAAAGGICWFLIRRAANARS